MRSIALALVALSGALAPAAAQPVSGQQTSSITLYATVRDFRPFGTDQGHPDFEHWTGNVRVGLLQPTLDENGRPHAASITGSSITAEFRNAAGDPINPALFNASLGDTGGQLAEETEPRLAALTSFDQWYTNIPGTNVATNIPITLTNVPGTNRYVFDSAVAEPYQTRGGFFPIDGQAYGNNAGFSHNYGFTTELEVQFQFNRNSGQVFRFSGDDDVWVFVDGRLVIDLGGVHGPKTQVVDLDRLSWLEDGHDYTLKVFHAERHTTGSNFKIDTTIRFHAVQPAAASALAD
jgi:fibro-slime domain-containing protein